MGFDKSKDSRLRSIDNNYLKHNNQKISKHKNNNFQLVTKKYVIEDFGTISGSSHRKSIENKTCL